MATYDTQYYPVSDEETATDDALSVRVIRDLGDSINNAWARVCAPVLVNDAFPDGHCTTPLASTAESVILRWAPRWVGVLGGGWNRLTWTINGYNTTANDVTWRLYNSWNRYTGPDLITAAGKETMLPYDSGSLAFSATTDTSDTYTTLVLVPNNQQRIFLLLTGQNATAADEAILSQITVTAQMVVS